MIALIYENNKQEPAMAKVTTDPVSQPIGISAGRYPVNDFHVYPPIERDRFEKEVSYESLYRNRAEYIAKLGAPPRTQKIFLKDVKHFMYQLGNIEKNGAVDALAASHYDLLVVPAVSTLKGSESFDMAGMVSKLKASKAASFSGKLVFAYFAVGEAEKYRTYWDSNKWEIERRGECRTGKPGFLVGEDPAKWGRSYVVIYWDARWKKIMKEMLDKVIAAGFDGAVLDWVDMYEDECIKDIGLSRKKDPKKEMVKLLKELKDYARKRNPNFKFITVNGITLSETDGFLKTVDGIIVEGAFYQGRARTGWDDPLCCDIEAPSERTSIVLELGRQMSQKSKIPIFSIDYAIKNAQRAYKSAKEAGFIPLVTRSSLFGITTTPPPGY